MLQMVRDGLRVGFRAGNDDIEIENDVILAFKELLCIRMTACIQKNTGVPVDLFEFHGLPLPTEGVRNNQTELLVNLS